MTITSEVLTGLSAALLALLFEYVPGLSGWYAALIPQYKKLTMAGLLLLVALVVFGLSCGGYIDGPTCDDRGAMDLLWMLAIAVGINQGTHSISKRSS